MTAPHAPFAVVTGGNRGLGHETCRQLAQRGYRVLSTSRDAAEGEQAAAALRSEGLDVESHALDVTDARAVNALAAHLGDRGQRIDALVNNAGASFRGFDADVVRDTLDVNFNGALRVTSALRPLLAEHARVVMVSSGMGELSCLAPHLAHRFAALEILPDLIALLLHFVGGVELGTHEADGWPSSAYSVSKVALNAFTRILARRVAADGDKILVNAVCPGWVRTDMGGPGATRSVFEGAAGIVWAATLPPNGPSGGFFRDGKAIAW
ncbi:MAG TPA: SDR family NAD(P)-dependent oxidoreductase [Haliangium sp.]|nr:SDR family NAD(P)-dependent oxidoreductase [Haliangium sp.]